MSPGASPKSSPTGIEIDARRLDQRLGQTQKLANLQGNHCYVLAVVGLSGARFIGEYGVIAGGSVANPDLRLDSVLLADLK
jgi:hypothetical protein